MFFSINKEVKERVRVLHRLLKPFILSITFDEEDIILDTTKNRLKKLLYFLKNISYFNYNIALNLSCVDIKERNRFYLCYNLCSTKKHVRVIVRVPVSITMVMESMTNIYQSFLWLEREIWDTFGVFFYNHRDLRRILTDYGFDGEPFRKDFPVSGYYEMNYEQRIKAVIYHFLEIFQEGRYYRYICPWEIN